MDASELNHLELTNKADGKKLQWICLQYIIVSVRIPKCLLRTASITGCLTMEAKEQDKFYGRPMERHWPAEEQDDTIWQDDTSPTVLAEERPAERPPTQEGDKFYCKPMVQPRPAEEQDEFYRRSMKRPRPAEEQDDYNHRQMKGPRPFIHY